MSNAIEFFQSAHSGLAIPAGGVAIEVAGRLCATLEPVEIVRSGRGEYGQARLAYNPAASAEPELLAAEDIETEFPMGASVRIGQYYNGVPPATAAFSVPLFFGTIEGIETKLGPKGEIVEIVARDFSARAERITVFGRRVAGQDGSTVLLPGLDTVFNPDGRGNASPAPVRVEGKSYTVFSAEPSQGKYWTYAQVIEYLLSEYVIAGQLQVPPGERLAALAENQVARDLDVTGLTLLEALERCCGRIGLRFKFVPRAESTGPAEAIVFYKSGQGRAVELNLQSRGQRLNISKTDIAEFHSSRNRWPVTHRHIGQGDFKVYEATFDLAEAWDPALEDTNYEQFSPSTNPDFYQVKDVYRKWCLNEAGDYTSEPYSRGEAFDFTKIFGTCDYAQSRRRFRPALTTDKQGKSLGYFLQVSFDGGENWWQYLYAFNNLLDECGIWLSSDQLDMDTWVAALKGVLRFRITASVVSDERVTCIIADGPTGSTAPVVDRLITLPRRFKYRKVAAQSIFANASDDALGVPDEVDDTQALHAFLRRRAGDSAVTIETADVQTPYLTLNYEVGDRVAASPEGRDLLSVHSDNRSLCTIERVRMDFRRQCTNLRVIRRRA